MSSVLNGRLFGVLLNNQLRTRWFFRAVDRLACALSLLPQPMNQLRQTPSGADGHRRQDFGKGFGVSRGRGEIGKASIRYLSRLPLTDTDT